jgi:flagellar biosynthesis protein FlhF
MRIKRYEAPSIQEALMKVKKDLGPDAVILYTRTFKKGGMFGFLGKTTAEITAGIDLNLLEDVAKKKPVVTPAAPIGDLPTEKKETPVVFSDPTRQKIKALQRELNEMKTTTYSNTLRDIHPANNTLLLSEGFARLKKIFLKQELEELLAQQMIQGMINDKIDPENMPDVTMWLQRFIARTLKIALPHSTNSGSKVMAFVGSTGVGKTTTLAKLAARFALMEKKKIVLITADTYRIAATEQLKTYGGIMGIPVEVAFSPAEVFEVIQRYQKMDLILLDTAGRSPTNDHQMQELKQLIFQSQIDEIYLVLSATTKYWDMIRIIERFGSYVPINRLIFTKLDETRYYGAFVNLMVNFQIPLAYFCVGQNVPDDLEIPEAKSLSERITQALLN